MKPHGLQLKFLLPLILLLLLLLLQYQLWFGVGNMHDASTLQQQVVTQQSQNTQLSRRNQELAAQVKDLKQGQAAVEEQARSDLGMIKQGENFYQIVRVPAPPAATH
ncbi:MAG: cell division protein FtsB [Gammaproteobacteria bacterium]|nr:cell division protein FtsB [Gammaproteobacteria bacterium]MBU6508827.1 cell division protein FtsB [Gammaproteobacteria bacterium]MDE1983131.1 cell division protein FtsB [Gammaproteobacteria bacterium]MDE2108660.1 cell division protein FtsB [Gammaproteobacteria bacterium]MDE2460165.1 cell division protein FtsB [Gammaproteobacteria bacterium]